MPRLGFYFDMDKCSGCRSCQVACKDRNNYGIGLFNRRMLTYETGAFPDAKMFHYSKSCNHCAAAACVATCPTGAMQYAEDGVVVHDDEACIGCGTCVNSCPYEVPILDADAQVARKCDSCKAQRDAGGNPVCVDACVMHALDFGDLDELESKYGSNLVRELPFLPSADETDPSTLISPKESLGKSYQVIQIVL